MNPSPDSTLQAVRAALTMLEIEHELDAHGNLVFRVPVEGGQHLEAVIFGNVLAGGFFDLSIFRAVFYPTDLAISMLGFCNTWNRERRAPRASVATVPDTDQRMIVLDFHMALAGTSEPPVFAANIDFALGGALLFWESAEQAL